MSQPVKLSDSLVLEARLTGMAMERSIAGQVEYWAKLGRAVEKHMNGRQTLRLARPSQKVSEILQSVGTEEANKRVAAYLESGPFPHYQSHPTEHGLLVRTDANGKRTVGKFVNRKFQKMATATRAKAGSAA